jgi:hypothetical protein
MNYSTAVFLINSNVRAIVCTYEAGDTAPRTTFKSLDPDIKKDDLVIVPTDTRHKMTVVKVVETDVEVDFDSPATMLWIVGKVDGANYQQVLSQEAQAIDTIKSAEKNRKRDELRKSILADQADNIKALPISTVGDIPPARQPLT